MRELSSEQVTPAPVEPRELISAAGFDPDAVRAVVITTTSAIAISADYPEPYIQPDDGGP